MSNNPPALNTGVTTIQLAAGDAAIVVKDDGTPAVYLPENQGATGQAGYGAFTVCVLATVLMHPELLKQAVQVYTEMQLPEPTTETAGGDKSPD